MGVLLVLFVGDEHVVEEGRTGPRQPLAKAVPVVLELEGPCGRRGRPRRRLCLEAWTQKWPCRSRIKTPRRVVLLAIHAVPLAGRIGRNRGVEIQTDGALALLGEGVAEDVTLVDERDVARTAR